MKIINNGAFIKIYTQDDWEEFTDLLCTCGHTVEHHEWSFLIGDKNTIQVTRCKKSGHCRQFVLNRNYKYGSSSYSYA